MKSPTQRKESRSQPIKISNFWYKISDVVIVYGPQAKSSIRTITDLKAEDMGSLVILKGIVVRANTVKP